MTRDFAGKFQGQVAVVPGGARGIGEGGAKVIVADLNIKKAKDVAASINGHAMEVDVADDKTVEQFAAACEANVSPVSSVITSAGVLQPPLPPEELPLETWDKVMDVDFRARISPAALSAPAWRGAARATS
jgi:NAD(P)-dependent dehydrogenase (short-subunit alcohol dehydrogenase family)